MPVAGPFNEKHGQESHCEEEQEEVDPEDHSDWVLVGMEKLFKRFLFLVVLIIHGLHSHQRLNPLADFALQQVAVAAEEVLLVQVETRKQLGQTTLQIVEQT